MSIIALLAAGAVNWAEAPPVPGQCSAPAADNIGRPGCFLAAEITLSDPPDALWWHIHEFDTAEAARAAARGRRWSATVESHGRHWLYVLGGREALSVGGARRAVVGPLATPPGRPVVARFMESIFTPGMRTRVHSHAGPEAFYVVEGEQCVETPGDRRKLAPGDTFAVPPGPHVQAAAKGRRNLTLILNPADAPWMSIEIAWTPSQYCAD